MAWNGARRTCLYQSLPATAGPGNHSPTIQFANGLRSLRMAHAGCLRSIGRSKSHRVRSLPVAITFGAFRPFERRAAMKSFRLSGPLEKIGRQANGGKATSFCHRLVRLLPGLVNT